MGVDGNGQLGFQHSSDLMLNCCPSSGMNAGSLSEKPVSSLAMNSMFGSSNGGKESCYGSDWDPVVPLNQSENLGASLMVSNADLAIHPYPIVTYTKGLSGTSQFMHYSSDTSVAEMLPKFPVLGGGSFSGIFNSYNLPGCAQNSGVFAPPNHASNKGVMIEKATVDSVHSQEDPQVLEERLRLASPNGKRKRNAGGDMQRDSAGDISEMKELDEKKQKTEESGSSDQSNKQTGKQIKDNCSADEESKGYIHVRARRGQATNSHSLAERLRREKINERMRLLQELVPGCSKITGKAVMLDEIINYVQSLQQQVEFLSMKLASVNPELNFDIDQILSKDSLHSRGILGLNLGMSSNHIGTQGIHQGGLPVISNLSSLYHHSIPQGMWDGDLQNLHHMGFDPNPTAGNLGPNGS